jgi:hypothetical protein
MKEVEDAYCGAHWLYLGGSGSFKFIHNGGFLDQLGERQKLKKDYHGFRLVSCMRDDGP